jgi:hypothetical protein
MTLADLFALLDRLGVTRYQKLARPTLPEYRDQDWREITINGVKGSYHHTGRALGSDS